LHGGTTFAMSGTAEMLQLQICEVGEVRARSWRSVMFGRGMPSSGRRGPSLLVHRSRFDASRRAFDHEVVEVELLTRPWISFVHCRNGAHKTHFDDCGLNVQNKKYKKNSKI
jgi:hypothetical protein